MINIIFLLQQNIVDKIPGEKCGARNIAGEMWWARNVGGVDKYRGELWGRKTGAEFTGMREAQIKNRGKTSGIDTWRRNMEGICVGRILGEKFGVEANFVSFRFYYYNYTGEF